METPAKRRRFRTGQIREDHHRGERQDQEPYNLVGRVRPFGIESRPGDGPSHQLIEQEPGNADTRVGRDGADHHDEEIRQIGDERGNRGSHRVDDIAQQHRCVLARPGEETQNQRYVEIENHQHAGNTEHPDTEEQDIGNTIRRDQLGALQADGPDGRAAAGIDVPANGWKDPPHAPEQEQQRQGGNQGKKHSQQDAAVTILGAPPGHRRPDALYISRGEIASRCSGGLSVHVGNGEKHAVAGDNVGTGIERRRGDRAGRNGQVLGQIQQAGAGGLRAFPGCEGTEIRLNGEQSPAVERDWNSFRGGGRTRGRLAERGGNGNRKAAGGNGVLGSGGIP